MQTAVNWMIDELIKKHVGKVGKEYIEIFAKAKEMEKQQIIDAYANGEDNVDNDGCTISKNGAVYYYNETFKKD